MQNDMRDRLVELLGLPLQINVPNQLGSYNTIGERTLKRGDCERLADHLIENNVVVLPCRVEQILYMVTLEGEIIEITVKNVGVKFECRDTLYDIWGIYMMNDLKYVIAILPHKIGKTIFYTKEEAEQKLKEMRVENG